MKALVFSGDRASKTHKLGLFLKKIFGKRFIKTALWDGYPSKVYLK